MSQPVQPDDILRSSVPVPARQAGLWRQLRAFLGPALLVSVGYMDPGNWATDLQAGAQYEYQLLWVVGVASFMAILLQCVSARLGIATGKDLAQCCRDWYPAWTRWPNWIACEVAIAACDVAESLGSAVALKLLFGIPILWGLVITAADVLLLLGLKGMGMRTIEAIILVLVFTISSCFFLELFVLPATPPDFAGIFHGLTTPTLAQPDMVYLAIGIVGATVMPHNLYLHSALVQSRNFQADDASVRRAIHFNTFDTVASLGMAFFVNAAILILAAHFFYGQSSVTLRDGTMIAFGEDADWIQLAYLTLAPLVGTGIAATLFAVALLASGQSSTITGTLAGQIVMEGFMHWRIRPWVRRLLGRIVAITPAIILVGLHGDRGITELLTLSQVILGMQLPLALLPLMHFASSRAKMGKWVIGPWMKFFGWGFSALIVSLALYGLPALLRELWHTLSGG